MKKISSLLKKNKISLILESYDDIFSDFDPRPFISRAISDDFLNEAQKVVRESEIGSFELHFLIPRKLRNKAVEESIKERLHGHFRHAETRLNTESRRYFKNGVRVAVLGFFLIFATSIVISLESLPYILANILRSVLEPGGWFMAWYGLDHVFYLSRAKTAELAFNQKMSKAELFFNKY